MDQSQRGNFIAYLNRDKEAGDRKPTFDGRLSIPGKEDELRFALWAHEYKNPKTGEVQIMFNGQTGNVATSAASLDQVASLVGSGAEQSDATFGNLTLAARQLVLFPNRFKDEAPEKDRPDYWGAFNPGNGEPVVRISAWAKKDRNQHAMLAGATSYLIPGKSEAQQQDTTVDLLVAAGTVTKGMPKNKSKGVSGRG